MSMNLTVLLYLLASICFIQSLKGLSHPSTSIKGNIFGIIGMTIAIVTTIFLIVMNSADSLKIISIVPSLIIGGGIGTIMAKRVEMTKMPELVAFMHSMIGLAAVCIAVSVISEPKAFKIVDIYGLIPFGNCLELLIGTLIGAITFSGSVVAFGKLSGKYNLRIFQGSPVIFPGQNLLNFILCVIIICSGALFISESRCSVHPAWMLFEIMTIASFILGILIIIPIGGADMPVVVSMLNSYSGWAAAGIGFSLNNTMLIIAGSLVGSSGAILSYIMCKAMNRSFLNVLFGGFLKKSSKDDITLDVTQKRSIKSGSTDDAVFLMKNAELVIIVPGYGLAVARAQHSLKELTEKLINSGVTVKYAIHPVAGRMPGHMNVLLAEAEISYDQVFEMDDINTEFNHADVVFVLGANDVVNPAAKTHGSPIFGMPILEAFKAKSIIINKRSMATGYAGLDNELFYMDKSMMVFGDAKKVIDEMIKKF